ALNSSDKAKLKGGQLQHQSSHILNHSLSPRPVSVKPDISKASSTGGKLHILKPSRERNGITPTPKESLSPTSGSKVPNSSLAVPSVVAPSPLRNSEKRPSPQAKSRNDFFNLMRKKSMANHSSSSPVAPDTGSSNSANDKPAESRTDDEPVVVQPSGDSKLDSSCNGDTCVVTETPASNGKINSSFDVMLYSEEEEAAFLRSLGWEETTEEEGLTEEEINSFYRDYVNLKPASNFFKGTQPKCMMPFKLQMGKNVDISSDAKVDLNLMEMMVLGINKIENETCDDNRLCTEGGQLDKLLNAEVENKPMDLDYISHIMGLGLIGQSSAQPDQNQAHTNRLRSGSSKTDEGLLEDTAARQRKSARTVNTAAFPKILTMSTNEQIPLSQPTSVVRNTLGKEPIPQDPGRPISDEALREYCDRNYYQILPIIAEKVHQEKVQQEKLKAVKACLNFEEASHQSESKSPEPRRGRSESPKKNSPERKAVFKRLEKGVFHRLGDKGKSVSVHSNDSRRWSHHSSRRDTESCHQSSRSRATESASERRYNKRASSRRTEELSESEGSAGGHWKSKLKRQKSSIEDDLSQPWSAAKTERWAMSTWCHMFNSTLTGNARKERIFKDPVEIHNIRQRDRESTEEFVRRYKLECREVKGAPECKKISGFMHGITNPELIKRLHDKIPKSVDEMMRVTTAFLRRCDQTQKESITLIKEIKQNNGKEQPKVTKKRETSGKDKALTILKVQPWERVARQKITQSFSPNTEISFPPLGEDEEKDQ
ncbi:hypothetical protein Tco_0846990, partial [Tanacetum coccineum]